MGHYNSGIGIRDPGSGIGDRERDRRAPWSIDTARRRCNTQPTADVGIGLILMVSTHTHSHARPKSMVWLIFIAGAVLSWGAYGALLYLGQTQLGNPLKALLCVG